MIWFWWRDHIAPGLITAAIVGASHARLWSRIRKLTAEQTRALKGGEEKSGSGGTPVR